MMTGMGRLQGVAMMRSNEDTFAQRIEGIDRDIKILVTHMPPRSILMIRIPNGDRIGSQAITRYPSLAPLLHQRALPILPI